MLCFIEVFQAWSPRGGAREVLAAAHSNKRWLTEAGMRSQADAHLDGVRSIDEGRVRGLPLIRAVLAVFQLQCRSSGSDCIPE